jgi:hypothetical protein
MNLDPRTWKSEHFAALCIGVALGAAVGLWVGVSRVDYYARTYYWKIGCGAGYYQDCTYLHVGYWLTILLWPLAGAVAAGALIYIRQLLRE